MQETVIIGAHEEEVVIGDYLEDTVIEVIIQGPQGPAGNAPYDGIRNGVIDTSPTENAVFDALGMKAELEHTHTWNEVIDTPATFPPSSHNHIISDVSNLQSSLDNKADVEHSHDATDIDGLLGILDSKANKVHTHTIGDVAGLQLNLDAKAPVIHEHTINDVEGLQEDLYNLQGEINTKAPTVHTHTIGQVTGLQSSLDSKSPIVHIHTIADVEELQEELNTLESSKAPTVHSHSISQVTGLQSSLDNKTNIGHHHAVADVDNLQSNLNSKSNIGHTHTYNEVSGVAPAIHNHVIADIGNLQGELDSKSDIGHTHTPAEIGAIATDGSSTVTGAIVFNNDEETKIQLNSTSKISTGSGKVAIQNTAGEIVLETTSPKIKQGGVEYEVYHENHIPTPAEVGAVNKAGDEMSGALRALNFQARDIPNNMQGIRIGGGAEYSEVIPVDNVGNILWTESLRYFLDGSGWTSQAPQGTSSESLTRKDYVNSEDSLRVLKSGDEMSGSLKALNFQARDIAQNMRGIWIGGGEDYSEVIPVDNVGSILWTESIRYFPNADKWTLQSAQGTAANSIARRDYVDSSLALKLNLTGGTLTGKLNLPDPATILSAALIGDTGNTPVDTLYNSTPAIHLHSLTSGASIGPAIRCSYSHQGAWGGAYVVGVEDSGVADAGYFTIGHQNSNGGNLYYLKFSGVTGDLFVGDGTSKVYHQGFKPTATDVGALPITGGTLTGALTLSADGSAESLQAATVRQIPTRKKVEVHWTGLSLVLTNNVPTNLINLLKVHTPASGTMAPFLNTTSDKLNVYNDDTSVGIKVNIIGSFPANNLNRSMHLDFVGTVGNRVVVNRNQGGVVPPDIMQFRTFLSIDKNGNVATNGTAMEILAAGADFTITEVLIVVEQVTALTSMTPVVFEN